MSTVLDGMPLLEGGLSVLSAKHCSPPCVKYTGSIAEKVRSASVNKSLPTSLDLSPETKHGYRSVGLNKMP